MTPGRLTPRDGFLIAVICVSWAGNFISTALGVKELPPILFSALRMGILAIALLPFLKMPSREQWPRLTLVALNNGAIHLSLCAIALKLAGDLASPAIALQSYVPMSALLAWWLLGERFAWRTGLAIAICFAGVLVLGFDPIVLDKPSALWTMLTAAFFLALGTIWMRGLQGLDAIQQQGWSALISVLPMVLVSFFLEADVISSIKQASWTTWACVTYSALVSSLLGHGLYFALIKRHPVAQITPYLLCAPVMAVIFGILVWGDKPGPKLFVGGAMVMGGVLIIAYRNIVKQKSSRLA
jgi:O-acetylserine/cysteine efflux transporter